MRGDGGARWRGWCCGAAGVGCGGGGTGDGPDTDGGAADSGTPLSVTGCADLFDQDKVRTYSIEIDPVEWQKLDDEFNNVTALLTDPNCAAYHPVVFHLDDETVTDAAVKLRGQSSWLLDRDVRRRDAPRCSSTSRSTRPCRTRKFHGYSKLVFDMPRSDWTFLHDRLAHTWLRQIGHHGAAAPANARLTINGSYYGLYTLSEEDSAASRRAVLSRQPGRRSVEGRLTSRRPTRRRANWARIDAFCAGDGSRTMSTIIDIDGSVRVVGRRGAAQQRRRLLRRLSQLLCVRPGDEGFLFLPQDTDATFEWLAMLDLHRARRIIRSSGGKPRDQADAHAGPALDARHERRRPGARNTPTRSPICSTRWDVAAVPRLDRHVVAQIAADVAADPHTWADAARFPAAIQAGARDRRDAPRLPAQLRRVRSRAESGQDSDGDGFRWCEDCRDDVGLDPHRRPGDLRQRRRRQLQRIRRRRLLTTAVTR